MHTVSVSAIAIAYRLRSAFADETRKVHRKLLEVLHKDFSKFRLYGRINVSKNTAVDFVLLRELPAFDALSSAEQAKCGEKAAIVRLHDNAIAYVTDTGWVIPDVRTYREWPTRTTRARLKALGVNLADLD